MAKAQTLKDRLDVIERLIAREESELSKQDDPLALLEPSDKDKLALDREADDCKRALGDPAVRRFFHRMFELGGLMEADSDPDPIVMAHHVGHRSLALTMYKAIEKSVPGIYNQMCREHESNLKSSENKKMGES